AAVTPSMGGDHPWAWFFHKHFHHQGELPPGQIATMNGGYWLWMHSPEQEKVAVMSLFNRYCIRCHGVDGRGIWDIPGIPDFTNSRWQASRTDGQLARIILEGRGAVMPPFRGAISLEEAWAIGRYLRTFEPGTQLSRPDSKQKSKNGTPAAQPKATLAPHIAPMPAAVVQASPPTMVVQQTAALPASAATGATTPSNGLQPPLPMPAPQGAPM